MAQQVPLPNKLLFFTACLFITASCSHSSKVETIPLVYKNADSAGWNEQGPLLYYNSVFFSGFQFRLYPDADTVFLFAYLDGKKEGMQYEWYPGKKKKELRHFVNGWQEGEQSGWFENGRVKFIYHFKNDVYNGNVKEWTENGTLYKDFNYANGQESGKELLLNPDGSIKANYEVRNGKIYGNSGTKNCASPWKKDSLQ